ncbi:MAG: dihydrodipicolinate synthase family protein [SAR202 cluster bacterium]|nr:dihydrodipicolinate synthase family protein [SAR202 cluster bacterium]
MNREDMRKLVVGAVATVPTPFNPNKNFAVDYGVMADMTRWWLENGLVKGKGVIKVAAFLGEGPQLREKEWEKLIDTVVKTAKGQAAIMAGIFHKDTVRTIEDAKRAQDLGVMGLQLTTPMFNDPTQDDLLRFYDDVNRAINIGMLLYNVKWGRGTNTYGVASVATMKKMVDMENFIAVKWSKQEGGKYEDIFEIADKVNIIDNAGTPGLCYKLGGKGFVSMIADVYPPAGVKIVELLNAGKFEEAQQYHDTINAPFRDFYTKVNQRSGGQARMSKAMAEIMGHPVGPMRPPSLPLLDSEKREMREILVKLGWPVAKQAALR